MSANDISKMDDKQLRNEVQLLRDELAIFKRKYEDIIYNLDDDNFSGKFLKEKDNMKTEIKVAAEGIKTKVSNKEFESAKTQLANQITSEVKTLDDTLSSRITQNANSIASEVTNRTNADTQLSSQITQTANGINATVSSNYNDLNSKISSVSVEAGSISSRVSNVENGKFKAGTLFKQTADTFLLDGEKVVFTGCIYITDNNNVKKCSIFHNESNNTLYIWDYMNDDLRIVIGEEGKVYLGGYVSGNEVATRQWVLENGGGSGGTAKFA